MKRVTTDLSSPPAAPSRGSWRAPLIAASLAGSIALLLAGCNKADAPQAPPPAPASTAPASPPPSASPGSTSQPAGSSSAPASSSPSGGSPASSVPAPAETPAPSSSATTPGTPDGARATLPSGGEAAAARPADGTAVDSKATDPKGDLTKQEESKGMPEAQQANNHSSPALDTEPKKE